MGFASKWLEERALFPELTEEAPDLNTGIIIVVPAYNEPGITELLDSLKNCHKPECIAEVIIVVNAPAGVPDEQIAKNKLTVINIESWKKDNEDCFFRLFHLSPVHNNKDWGVGMARKTGMDEAARRFDKIDRPDGVIVCLDADCLVEKNYLTAIHRELLIRKDRSACSIHFEHPISGKEFPDEIYEYITQYELHLRYFYQGLIFAGFPSVFHTVGSAIAVKSLAYVKAGGMNRRQAGEDFYFIQKLIPAGGYFTLNSTTVFPSPRTSFRVPFGTGASMQKLTNSDGQSLLTYNLLSFIELKVFLEKLEDLYNCSSEELTAQYSLLPEGLQAFMGIEEWSWKFAEIRNNTSGYDSFRKRFFGWFNMFKIVKYLNDVHQRYFEKMPVVFCASALLEKKGISAISSDPSELLLQYRFLEKSS